MRFYVLWGVAMLLAFFGGNILATDGLMYHIVGELMVFGSGILIGLLAPKKL